MPFPTSTLGLSRPARRRAIALAIAAVASVILLPAVSARADSPTTLTVVGTSDVQDSGLVPNLITPMFEKAFPQFTLKYVSVGTGVAISDAESGVASALIVHAASLENQFVQQGYSNEPFGRAIFYGDYVLLGPKSDPAGVLTGAPNDIASAFAKVAAAGAAGKADLVSRGGTPGTTVQEHAIWALDAGTPGLTLCTVSTKNGGGDAPSTASGNCPTNSANPSWYHTTGQNQATNIATGNTCNFPNAANGGANDCYVFTDRGTFECLQSATCSAGAAAPGNLQIVTRNNSATAKGGSTLLINSFHAYAINPAKFAGNPNVQLNTTAAEDFLEFITSPSFQAQLKSYLASTNDAPFVEDAAPNITVTKFKQKVTGGTKLTLKGTVANAVPGTPPLANEPVAVTEVGPGGAGIPVASGKTDSSGAYSISFTPTSTGSYQVTTGKITQIENSSLNPVFGDLLQPGASPASTITVTGAFGGLTFKGLPGRVLATGLVKPGASHVKGSVTLLARHGQKGAFKAIGADRLGGGDGKFAISVARKAGSWSFKVRFQDPGQISKKTSSAKKLSVPAADRATVTASSEKVKGGKLTIKGKLGPAPSAASTTIQVLGLDVGSLQKGTKSLAQAAAAAVKLKVLATVKVKAGAKTFTAHAKLRRGQRWIVGVQYAAGGAAGTAYGALKTVRVP